MHEDKASLFAIHASIKTNRFSEKAQANEKFSILLVLSKCFSLFTASDNSVNRDYFSFSSTLLFGWLETRFSYSATELIHIVSTKFPATSVNCMPCKILCH